jgi:serine/threonine-protein kinase HipA
MIKSSSGWILAPAYDLLNVAIILPSDKEELAIPIEGKKKDLKNEHFVKFGKGLGLSEKQIDATFARMLKKKDEALNLIDISFLSKTMKTAYKDLFEKRYRQIELIK